MKPKRLGIWMDHDHAHAIEFLTESLETKTVPFDFKHETKRNAITHGEDHELARQQRHKAEYFKELGNVIKNYQEVLLFGPTTAKTELLHKLTDDQQFSHINIQIEQRDKMTEKQMHAFVRKHFSGN